VHSLGVHYYYPGYVVEHDPKMNYKLFLGIDAAAYFDPETIQWKPLRALPDFGHHFARAR
jgi:arginyl-tRNA--protein-N-Asp/Glu arginylyltransferase